MPPRTVIFVLLSVTSACGAEHESLLEAHQREAAITNGQPYSGHPSVGQLMIGKDGGECTATLIGKKTVLTAGHCVEPGSTHVFVAGGVSYPAASTHRYPGYDPNYLANDIAIVILGQAPPIAPSAIATSAPWVGLKVTLIGYGCTYGSANNAGTDYGIKRITTNSLSQVNATTLIHVNQGGSTGSVCFGDSGGPMFATIGGKEVEVGIASALTGDVCGGGAYHTRVDAYASWIKQTAAGDVNTGDWDLQPPAVAISSPGAGQRVDAPLTVSATITDNVGVVRAELSVDGQPGTSLSAQPWDFTLSGLAAGAHTLRVAAFDAANNKGEATVQVTVEASPEPTPATGTFGDACHTKADCASALCALSPSGQFCTQSCGAGTAGCPSGAACVAVNGQHVCGLPAATAPDNNEASPTAKGEVLWVGSCSAAPGPAASASWAWPLVGLLVLWLRRRAARMRSSA